MTVVTTTGTTTQFTTVSHLLPTMDASSYSSINDLLQCRTIEDYDSFSCVLAHPHSTVCLLTPLSLVDSIVTVPGSSKLIGSVRTKLLLTSHSTSPEILIPHVARKTLVFGTLSRQEHAAPISEPDAALRSTLGSVLLLHAPDCYTNAMII